jgi:acetolactate synthase I/III small subunit
MRHIISILLENQAGALTRVAGLFSTRGYNIESLNVAPTDDERVSRLTLVTIGSDEVIAQISKQLAKLVDVVSIADMTGTEHIERELALFKVRAYESSRGRLTELLGAFGGHVLSYDEGHGTLELVGNGPEIDSFMDELGDLGQIETVVRSGAMAMARGTPVLNTDVED